MKPESVERYKKVLPYLIVVLVFLFGFAVYYTFFSPVDCNNYACFQKAMGECRRASYLNEDNQATWQYTIDKRNRDACLIDVKLLQAKQGSLDLDKITGYSMTCSYSLGVATYPDQDLGKCHGRLKEELQTIIIQRLHVHIVENLANINEKLNSV